MSGNCCTQWGLVRMEMRLPFSKQLHTHYYFDYMTLQQSCRTQSQWIKPFYTQTATESICESEGIVCTTQMNEINWYRAYCAGHKFLTERIEVMKSIYNIYNLFTSFRIESVYLFALNIAFFQRSELNFLRIITNLRKMCVKNIYQNKIKYNSRKIKT